MSAGVKISFDQRVNAHEDAAVRFVEGFMYHDGLAPGAAWFVDARSSEEVNGKVVEKIIPNAVLRFSCPCGCGAVAALPIDKTFDQRAWSWNGNKDLPSTQPSIQMLTPCRWHGYLTDGVFKSV